MARPDQLVGLKLGRYQIDALLGQGRSAYVYQATDAIFARTVAIKVLDAVASQNPAEVAAFLRDAEEVKRLSHPHILPIYQATQRDGIAFLVRQLTDGGTLRGLLHKKKTLPVGEAITMLRPIGTALDYAHRQGFVHGNLKPSNILLTKEGHVFVTDFVVPGQHGQNHSAVTTIVSIIDAPEYASPEQARGEAIEPQTDLYVLGVILYEAVLGRPPFRSENSTDTAQAVIARRLQKDPPPPRTLLPRLGVAVEEVLLRSLARQPEERYPTGAALFYALTEAADQDALSASARAAASASTDQRSDANRQSRAQATASWGMDIGAGERHTEAIFATDAAILEEISALVTPDGVPPGSHPAEDLPELVSASIDAPIEAPIEAPTEAPTEALIETLAPIDDHSTTVPDSATLHAIALPEEQPLSNAAPAPEPATPAPIEQTADIAAGCMPEATAKKQRKGKAKQASHQAVPTQEVASVPAGADVGSAVIPAEPPAAPSTTPSDSQAIAHNAVPAVPVATVTPPPASAEYAASAQRSDSGNDGAQNRHVPMVQAVPAHRSKASQSNAWRYVVAVFGILLVGVGILSMLVLRSGKTDVTVRADTPGDATATIAPESSAAPRPSEIAAASPPPSGGAPAATAAAVQQPSTGAIVSPTNGPVAASTAPRASASAAPATLTRQEVIVFAGQPNTLTGSALYAVNPDGKNQRQLAQLPGQVWGARIAPDSRSVVYSVAATVSTDPPVALGGLLGNGQHDLYLLNTDGSAPVRLTTTTAWNAGWSWSPDGKTLAFTSNRDGNWEIYTLAFPGSKITRLTNNPEQDGWPTWSPDGKTIVFMSTRDGQSQLYSMHPDGSNVARLFLSETNDSYPAFSPDGSKIAFVSETPGGHDPEIYTIAADGSGATRLTTTGNNTQPTWSPDSARIAFVSTRDGRYNLFTMRADGSAQTQITSSGGAAMTPTWGYLLLSASAPARAQASLLVSSGALLGGLLVIQPLGTAFRRRTRPIARGE